MPRKVLDRDDLDTSHEYPFAVPEDNAEGATWVSPTKAVKEYHQPLKRKRRASGSPTPRSGTGKRAVVGETDNLAPEETYSHDVGPSDLWDLSLMDHEAQTDQVASEEGGADALANYLEAVETFGAGWYCINDSLFVVQGWDARRSNWYHLQHLEIEQEVVVACTCPRHTQDSTCVHSQFFNLYDVESLSAMTASSEAPGNEKAIIFYRQQLPNAPEFLTMFSVQGFSTSELKGRAIVSHTGVLPSAGTWKCSKHAEGTLCVHVQDAFHRFQTLVGDNGQELDPAIFCKAPALATIARTGAISHSAILPPISLALTNDPAIYPRPPPFRNPPESTLSLNHAGSCPCPTGRTFYSPLRPTDTRSCRIFTLFTVYEGTIEVQPCPTCPAARRRLVGPDLVELGLFNFNNSIIVSHELLDEYTMAFVTSETPFNAFVATLNHRYAVSGAEFIGDDLFHSIWFAYATCLAMDNDMQCTRCGRCPDTVIWDGITLAFGRKHLSATLVPPTQVSVQSLQRSNVKNHPRQQLLLDSSLRKLIRQAVNPPKLTESQPEDVLNEPASNAARIEQSRHSRLVVEHLARIDAVYDGLRKECEALARLFLDAYGAVAFAEKKPAPAATTRFFLQVAAEESVLQMVNATALSNLNEFLAAPDVNHLTKILAIPGLYRMLKEQSSIDRLIPIGRWLADRAAVVLRELSVEHIPLSTGITPAVARADWKVVFRLELSTAFPRYDTAQLILA
ncbi:hypothetical protein MD484_g7877, partial [Candolleomyces efflorescens]